jgi:hypothetical protein
MYVITTKDRVHLDAEELQQVLKAYIQDKLGREVCDEVYFQKNNGDGKLTAYAHLKHVPPPAPALRCMDYSDGAEPRPPSATFQKGVDRDTDGAVGPGVPSPGGAH